MGIPLLRERAFTSDDRLGAQTVAMIDENMAQQYWPTEDPIGKHLRIDGADPWATIIGVVAPVRHSQAVGEEVSSEGTEGAGKGVYYFPIYQTLAANFFLIARTSGNSGAETIRQAVRSVDLGQPLSDVKTMDERIALSMGPRRSAVALLTVFASMALALAAIGLFGLVVTTSLSAHRKSAYVWR